jgi:hypothetical protein
MTVLKNRQEYDAERHGNVFDWIVAESKRLRHWQKPPEPVRPREPVMRSLRGENCRYAVHRRQPDEARTDKPLEDVFELARARKL